MSLLKVVCSLPRYEAGRGVRHNGIETRGKPLPEAAFSARITARCYFPDRHEPNKTAMADQDRDLEDFIA